LKNLHNWEEIKRHRTEEKMLLAFGDVRMAFCCNVISFFPRQMKQQQKTGIQDSNYRNLQRGCEKEWYILWKNRQLGEIHGG
jgi:hypothetical protein